MADYRDDDDRPEFPPELQECNPADGWADGQEWHRARVEFAREHGVFGRLPSGKGRILPLLQEMVQQPDDESDGGEDC